MARLVAVCRSDDYQFERRQLPLVMDDAITMVIQFSEKCADCEHVCGVKQRELDRFVQKFDILTKAEIAVALMVTSKDVLSLLSQTVPCVGCRRSVERLFNQLVQFQHPALEPLIITADGVLSIKHDLLFDSKTLYALFYIHGAKLNSVMESIPKSKKNKRCNLHSLDTHKTRSSGSWIDIWDLLSQECREDVVLVDADGLSDTLEAYLRKHRFCAECKSKVLRAYSILTGEVSCTKEKGYCPSLYEGLRCCTQERHIHMLCDTDFIARLIGLAEPELAGSSRRDRHAKTLEIAQEEVLTCLGIHVYERLHQIGQKLKAEEQTWQILFYLGMDALKKSFEMAVERKQGVSNLELVCKELLEEERIREQKREMKRQKKKKRRARLQTDLQNNALRRQISSECKCDSPKKSPTRIYSEQCRDHSSNLVSVENCRKSSNVDSFCQVVSGKGLSSSQKLECIETCCGCEEMNQTGKRLTMDNTGNSDCGYSSGAEGCENCGVQSSNESSDVICSDDLSNNEVFLVDCDGSGPNLDTNSCYNCGSANLKHGEQSLDQCNHLKQKFSIDHYPSLDQHRMMPLSLQAMLEASRSSDEDVISEEEIKQFRENESVHLRMRQELRETLRQRFKKMQQRAHCVGKTSYKTMDQDAVVRKLCNL